MQLPSGAINNAIVFNYNGKVYASDESRMLAEQKDDTFCLGSLDTYTYEEIFYGETAQEISNVWANEGLAGCADCGFEDHIVVQTQFSIMLHKAICMVIDLQMVIVRRIWKLFDIYLKEWIMISKLLTFSVLGFHENIINYKYDFTTYQRKGSKY